MRYAWNPLPTSHRTRIGTHTYKSFSERAAAPKAYRGQSQTTITLPLMRQRGGGNSSSISSSCNYGILSIVASDFFLDPLTPFCFAHIYPARDAKIGSPRCCCCWISMLRENARSRRLGKYRGWNIVDVVMKLCFCLREWRGYSVSYIHTRIFLSSFMRIRL